MLNNGAFLAAAVSLISISFKESLNSAWMELLTIMGNAEKANELISELASRRRYFDSMYFRQSLITIRKNRWPNFVVAKRSCRHEHINFCKNNGYGCTRLKTYSQWTILLVFGARKM